VTRVLVTAGLVPGADASARMLVAGGPPFDPAAAGFEQLAVFVGEDQVMFLFEGPHPLESVERLAGEVEVWKAGLAWRGLLDGEPRVVSETYSWRHPPRRPLHAPGF
jgi:hypothetical protein